MVNWLDLSGSSNLFKQVYVKGFVDISGGDFIARNGNLRIGGDASLNNNVYVNNKIRIGIESDTNYYLDVSGNAHFNKNVEIDGDLTTVGSVLFNGTPLAPTAVAGTNTTQIATTEYVTNAVTTSISSLVDGAPGALDTLKELSVALGDDNDFSSTITNMITNASLNADASLNLKADIVTVNASVNALETRDIALDASVNALETHDIALDASINALETHDIALDASVNYLETHDIALDTSVNALETHDIALDASVNALETHDIALDASVNALETHDIALDASVNALETHDIALDASVNALETHDIALDVSVNALETHDIALDASVNALETHDIALDASVSALETHDIALDASVNALETHNIALDASVNALETHDIALDASVNYLETHNIALDASVNYLETHDIALDASVNALETHDIALDASVNALETHDIALDASVNALETHDIALDASVNALETHDIALDASVNALRFNTDASLNLKADIVYVDNAVSGLVNSAPDTLNTLNELAAALGDDVNFSTTITTLIGSNKSNTDASLNVLETHDIALDASVNALETHDLALDASVSALETHNIALDASVNALETHDLALDASVNALETHDLALDASISALETHDLALDASVNALETHDIALDASVNALETHDIALDTSINALETHDLALDISVNALETHDIALDASVNALETHDLVLDASVNALRVNTDASLNLKANIVYVDNAVSGLVNSAPDTLNTLNELATALGDDVNFSTTITTLIGSNKSNTDVSLNLKANLSAPVFTGTVTAGQFQLADGTALGSNTSSFTSSVTAPNYLIPNSSFTGFDGIVKGMYGAFYSAYIDENVDGLNIGTNDYNGRIGMSIVNEVTVNTGRASLQFHTHDHGDKWRTPMTIKYNGSVGIGTNNPQYVLDVSGQIAGHSDSIFYRNTTASAKVPRSHAVLTLENDANNATYIQGKPCLFMGWNGTDAWAFGQGGTTGISGHTTTLGLGPGNNTITDAYGWTPKFNFGNNGHMGIGTNAPLAPLHIAIENSANVGGNSAGYYRIYDGGYAAAATTNSFGTISLLTKGGILTEDQVIAYGGVITASDIRIKDNIVDVQDDSALETLRQLKPKKYTYKDVIKRGDEPVWGFIAHEVSEILPYSTTLLKETIPNIYELGSVSGDNHDIVTLTTYKTSDFSKDASANLHKTIEFRAVTNKTETAEIIEVIDEYTFKVDKDLSDWSGSLDSSGNIITETQEEIQYDASGNELVDASGNVVKTTKTTYPGNEIFVYGQEVDDFHILKKDVIWTVATAALQEVDRQLQEEKQKTSTLESQVADLLTRVIALENA